ncbi:hypothetical protein AC249_AIPGENE24612 [Exaiptasia diaphana]|nr:hypothetical protein AC249_AIPGENE24612 [Exaiptasia diaphana]
MKLREERLMLQRKHEGGLFGLSDDSSDDESMLTVTPSKTSTISKKEVTSEHSEATMFKKKMTSAGPYEMSETSGPSETKSKEKMTTVPQLHELDEPAIL